MKNIKIEKMEITINSDEIENIDENFFSLTMVTLVIQRKENDILKIIPFLVQMSEKKIKKIWSKVHNFLTFDEKKWLKSLIKEF